MVTIPWWFVRYGCPALALAAVTMVVLLARPALHGGEAARPKVTAPQVQQAPKKKHVKPARASTYAVRSGDTLASIAEKFGTTVDRLMELNPESTRRLSRSACRSASLRRRLAAPTRRVPAAWPPGTTNLTPVKRLAVLVAVLACSTSAASAATPEVDARAYLVEEAQTGEVLLARRAHDRLPIASITKLMTVLVALERSKPGATVSVDPDAVGVTGSTIRLRAGERLPLRDLVAAALIQSANDSAVALAEHVGGGDSGPFVEYMNQRAKALGLSETQFARPDGLDTPGHYSSASDVTRLALEAMKSPVVRRLVRQESASISGGRTLHTWNDLLGEFPAPSASRPATPLAPGGTRSRPPAATT